MKFPRPLMPWGEKVHFVEGGGKMKPNSAAPKWSEGIFLGLVDKSSEYIIGTPMDCVKSSNAKRMTKADARDPSLFNAVAGTPWKMAPSIGASLRQEDLPARAMSVRAEAVAVHELPVQPHMDRATGPRKVYIRKDVELARYGFTPACRGCHAAVIGGGVSHS